MLGLLDRSRSHERAGPCFIDADTRLASGILDRLVGQVAEGDAAGGAMVSVQPWHEVRGVIERGSACFNLLAIMGTGMATPSRTASRRGERSDR